jgi:hypothetical protein
MTIDAIEWPKREPASGVSIAVNRTVIRKLLDRVDDSDPEIEDLMEWIDRAQHPHKGDAFLLIQIVDDL